MCIFWRCLSPCVASGVLGIHQNNVSTSKTRSSSVFSKAPSFCFVTEEAVLINLHGKPGKQAGKGEKIKYFSSAVQQGECMQSVEGEGRMKPGFLFTQHRIAAFQMEGKRLRLFIPRVPATLRPMTLISVRHQYNIICLVLLHPCESEQIDTSEKKARGYSSIPHFYLLLYFCI